MLTWYLSLANGLIGSLVGGIVTAVIAGWQMKKITKNHKEALEHERELLKQTFADNLMLQVADRKLNSQLEVLQELYSCLTERIQPVYLEGHQLRNNLPQGILNKGKLAFVGEVNKFQKDASDAVVAFGKILDKNKFQTEIYGKFGPTLSFQSKLWEPISLFLRDLDGLGPNPTRQMLEVISDKTEGFRKAIDEFGRWVQEAKDLRTGMQKALLDGQGPAA